MFKRIAATLFAAALAFCLMAPAAFAQGETYIRDEYGILTQDQLNTLEARAQTLSESQNIGVYFLFTSTMDEDDRDGWCIDYYTRNNLGMGSDQSGVLFVVAVDSRDYDTIANNRGNEAYRYYSDYIEDVCVVPLLSANRFSEAPGAYLAACEAIAAGQVSDEYYDDGSVSPLVKLLIALAVGIIAAGVACFIFYSQMKTAKEKAEANDYLNMQTFQLSRKHDSFVHSTLTKTPKPKKSESSGGGGGFSGSGGGKF